MTRLVCMEEEDVGSMLVVAERDFGPRFARANMTYIYLPANICLLLDNTCLFTVLPGLVLQETPVCRCAVVQKPQKAKHSVLY